MSLDAAVTDLASRRTSALRSVHAPKAEEDAAASLFLKLDLSCCAFGTSVYRVKDLLGESWGSSSLSTFCRELLPQALRFYAAYVRSALTRRPLTIRQRLPAEVRQALDVVASASAEILVERSSAAVSELRTFHIKRILRKALNSRSLRRVAEVVCRSSSSAEQPL